MICQFRFLIPSMVMVAILYAGDVVSMGHLSHSLAVIPTPKPMIRCDAVSLFLPIYNYNRSGHDLVLVQPFSQCLVFNQAAEANRFIIEGTLVNFTAKKRLHEALFRFSGFCFLVTIWRGSKSFLLTDLFGTKRLWKPPWRKGSREQQFGDEGVVTISISLRMNTANLFSISWRRQVSESSLTTFIFSFLIKGMPSAFWSFIEKMIANYKYMREGLNRCYLLARKASVWKAGSLPLFHRNCVQFPLFALMVVFDLFSVTKLFLI